ncbi:transposase [Streptomyces sp. NPDC005402]|uniref:transposase n=1 Tax=Streptomyces sp. NPDC005402 TaxID=3155338 RepID=UPI0033A86E23
MGDLLGHRPRTTAEERVRAAEATGLSAPPLRDGVQNQIWLDMVQIALGLLARMPMPTGASGWREPRFLRLRLSSAAVRLVTSGRRHILRLAQHQPWTDNVNRPGFAQTEHSGPGSCASASRLVPRPNNRQLRRSPPGDRPPAVVPPAPIPDGPP